jgi:signal transduction histidine kinase
MDHQTVLQNGVTRPLYRSSTVWAALAIFAVSLSVYWFIDLNAAFEVINAIAMATSLGVTVAWLPLAIHSVRKNIRELRSDDVLFIGVELLSANGFIIFSLLWLYRLTENPLARPRASIRCPRWGGAGLRDVPGRVQSNRRRDSSEELSESRSLCRSRCDRCDHPDHPRLPPHRDSQQSLELAGACLRVR